MDSALAPLFVSHSVKKLNQMSGYIELCLSKLSPEQIWQREGDQSNAIGNLVLHLCGNVQQWIIHGVAGEPDSRNRNDEFAKRTGLSVEELTALNRATIARAVSVINALSAERLIERAKLQDGELSVLEAVYQVVGHYQQHTGQIIFATKQFTGEDLKLYRPA